MKHDFTSATSAKLIRGNKVAQFGDGSRQVSGPTVAEGTVEELMKKVRSMPAGEAQKIFFSIDGVGHPLTLDETHDNLKS